MMPPPAIDDAAMPTASVAATLTDSPSPDVAVAAADSATDDMMAVEEIITL